MANEKRLIDANSLIRYCEEIAKHEWNKRTSPVSWADAYEGFIDDVDEMPTVDAVEVVHGRWIKTRYFYGEEFSCSACGGWKHIIEDVHEGLRFCPNCGAKMRGDKE